MDNPSQRMIVQRLADYPFLEVITGPAQPYKSPRHLHEELEIALNPGRNWNLLCRGKIYHVSSRAILLTPPEEPHEASSLEAGEQHYIGLRIHPDFLHTAFTEMTECSQSMLFFPELVVDDESFSQNILSLHNALQDEHCSRLEQDALLQDTVLHLLRFTTNRFTPSTAGQEPEAIRVAKAYMNEYYQKNISLHALAQQVCLSPFYFSRIFRASVGLPPHAYLMQIRISHAKRLLAQGVPLVEVAIHTGFHSQSHLNLHFKRVVGVTLGQYVQDCGLRVGIRARI